MADPDVRWIQRLENYGRALAALARAVDTANLRALSELEEQGLIQAFEFTHELSWLLLKDYLTDQGVSGVSGSRDAVREAVTRDLLNPGSESNLDGDDPQPQPHEPHLQPCRRSGDCRTDREQLCARTARSAQHHAGTGCPPVTIPGLPEDASRQLLQAISTEPRVQRVVLYGSRALGRQRSGSDVDLCLTAPDLSLGELLELGAKLDDLLLPWRIDLQLDHLIHHAGLREHIQRAGRVVWEREPS